MRPPTPLGATPSTSTTLNGRGDEAPNPVPNPIREWARTATPAPASPPPPSGGHRGPARPLAGRAALAGTVVVLVLVLLGSVVTAIAWGAAPIPWGQTVSHLWTGLIGGTIAAEDFTSYTVVAEVRAPRVLLALVVGAGLSVLGVACQALVRNPLADPFILGMSSGASVGASAVVSWGIFSSLGVYALSGAAFAGALVSAGLVYFLSASREGLAPLRLVLTGVVLAYGFQALMSTIVFFEPRGDAARTVMFWLLGSLGGASWPQVPVAAVVVLGCTIFLFRQAPRLDVLSLGDASAASMGVDARSLRRRLFLVTVLGTGVLVAVSGAVGFVGLVVPHLVRLVVGPSHRLVLLLAPLAGGIFLVWVDLLSRTAVPPRELPLGVVTALIGVPVFVVLIRRRGYVFGGAR